MWMKTLLISSIVMVALASPALAADRCNAGPESSWKPQGELEKILTDKGWSIRKVKIDDGCYEVYATDKDGNRKEVYFHPKTFEVVADES
jgi:hypothetical protein